MPEIQGPSTPAAGPGSPFGDPDPRPPSLLRLLKLWFAFSLDVTPLAYASSGFGLIVFKYAFEAVAILSLTGRFFSPLDFLNPLLSMRQQFFAPPAPDWLPWFLFFWTLP
ncbi:MAG TPA: hypothetical protein VGX76_22815, partial [Pirellulales bacterium]|nr:hypothetical protein [Pirellulales bacterium]